MNYALEHKTDKQVFAGSAQALGAVLTGEGVNFAVFSEHAKEVYLLLFNASDAAPTDIIKIQDRTENIWHVFVPGLKAGQLYAYKAKGDYNPKEGMRFNHFKLLIDPYAKALTGKVKRIDNLEFGYDVNSPEKDLKMDERDNTEVIPKSIVIDDEFDWQGDTRPHIDLSKLIIYEVHLKGFTAHGASSRVSKPGTYQGFIEKIPYLQSLGINALEFLPVHEHHTQDYLLKKGLNNYWGYDTIGFFTPESSYGSGEYPGSQVPEFKAMVREVHKAGMEVILDVVYNHSAEGNELGPTLCFKGLDNPNYYYLMENKEAKDQPYRYYKNDTGCGNTFNGENPAAMRLLLDSLRYWVEIMHVDGFRFDLASIITRVHGEFSQDSAFFAAVSKDPVLSKVKMIAEPWDFTTYQVGNFPKNWSEWNDKFRDTARKFIKGDDGQAAEMARRLTGSSDLYQEDGKHPYNSINFITCHDGFTLRDLFSYNTKHNEANQEENRDGSDNNYSWNCGMEGETIERNILELRKKLIKNAFCCLLFSSGTPMILAGDEFMRTQKGNNNAWCQDNDLAWVNWHYQEENSEILEFFKKAAVFRKDHQMERRRFYTGQDTNRDNVPDIIWYNRRLRPPKWDSVKLKTLCFQIDASEDPAKKGNALYFFIFNSDHRGGRVYLPQYEGKKWYRVVNTALKSGHDFYPAGQEKLLRNQDKYYCTARSVVVLLGK